MKDFTLDNHAISKNAAEHTVFELGSRDRIVPGFVLHVGNIKDLPFPISNVSYDGVQLQAAGVFETEEALHAFASDGGLTLKGVDVPAAEGRDAFMRKWAKKTRKNKKGLIPVLLLPLAACGGGEDPISDSFSGVLADAKALDLTKYTADFSITLSDAGAVSAADLSELAGDTTGTVASANVTSITGTAADVQTALDHAQLVSLD
ncbi:MAG: hypothetical protein HOL77_15535, partial [Rhodobacteraceae bacterium]|nr:hypothetical protein [Paracoccaceae bacterium]